MKEEFYPILSEKKQTVSIDVENDFMIYADPNKIARVFNNIFKNAFYYGDASSTIQVKAYHEGIYSHILFSNVGNTIPKDKLNRIFEQFYRLDESRSSTTGGSGLGLSIAKMIVDLHHGHIKVTSENRQTVFEVILPRQPF